MDRVLGKGFVPGAALLVGGEPGIGKSTLLLQAAGAVAASGKLALYLSGEESLPQIKGRAERLGVLIGQRAIPSALERAGFQFHHNTIGEALGYATARRDRD